MVGEEQLTWLMKDLQKIGKSTPVVVFSHSPLQKIYKGWNFWTDDAEKVQALLKPFDKVTVIYGHVHQIQYNQIGNISFHAVMATAWPWPYPQSYAQVESHLPRLTVPMNRADPFFERDATGWQFIDARKGNVAMHYQLPDNENRSRPCGIADRQHIVDVASTSEALPSCRSGPPLPPLTKGGEDPMIR